jgi:tripartite-type tricarboxylate transporter receptor subunit TctC
MTCALSQAQDFPTKPVRLIVGFPPGGSNDIVARVLSPKLSELLGQQVVVENRAGANAIIGTDFVAKSAPDGYTLLLGSVSPLVISPHAYSKLPYDTLADFAPITSVAMTPEIIAVHPSLPAKSLKELVALARSQPGKLSFSSSGNGGLPHLAIELFKTSARVNVLHVAYKGAAPAITDTMGGHVDAIVMDFPPVLPHVKSGRLRGLAMASERRAPLLPELPTTGEQGLPDLLAVNWFTVLAPVRTPRAVVDRVYAVLIKSTAAPEIKERLLNQGVETMTQPSPVAATAFIKAELARWGKVAKAAGVRAD